jgi:hypothetical protein
MITKHAGGRPTKYNELTVTKADEYISTCGKEQMSLPTLEGLAIYLDVTSETIRQWEKEHLEFSLTIKKITDLQKQQLMDDGMYGGKEVNSTMAIFLLKVNHGMIETSRTELGGINGQPITIVAGKGFLPPNTKIDTIEPEQIEGK